MADAGLIAGIVGAVVGALGATASAVALVYAHMANDKAKRSITIAGESRDLAVEANDLSRQSNTIATGAREIAQDANDISRRSEARETERHDVRWDYGWLSKQQGIYALTKRGSDVAHHVKATVKLGSREMTQEVDAVAEDGARIQFRFGPHALEPDKTFGEVTPSGMVVRKLNIVSVRVDWTTELGTPKNDGTSVPA